MYSVAAAKLIRRNNDTGADNTDSKGQLVPLVFVPRLSSATLSP